MSKFDQQGLVFLRGKVLKLEFDIPNSSKLRFFVFKGDVQKLLDGALSKVVIFKESETYT